MNLKFMNGKALPIFLGVTLTIPTLAGTYLMGATVLKWDWDMQFAAQQVDNLPLVLHAGFAIAFLLLGALQVLPGFRGRNLTRHRKLGRIAAASGLIGAISGVWMTLLHPDIATDLLYYARLLFGILWALFILMGVRFAMLRNITDHRAFMIRAYAIAANAGTLPFIYMPIYLVVGEMSPTVDDGIQVLGWVINLSVAEWIIRKPQNRKKRKAVEAIQPAAMAMASDIKP